MSRASLLVLVPVGCATPPPPDAAPEARSNPAEWDYVSDGDAPAADVVAITTLLQDAVDRVRTFHTGPILAAYTAATAGQVEGCPAWYGIGQYTYWYDNCTTAAGDTFNGYTFDQQRYDLPGYRAEGRALWGSSTVTLADGRVLHLGGRLESVYAQGQGQQLWTERVQGTHVWTGDDAVGTWLGDGYALDIELFGTNMTEGTGGRNFLVRGGIDGFGGAYDTVRFESLSYTVPGEGAPLEGCLPEPAGAIAVRDAAGVWYEVAFDGFTGETEGDTGAPADTDPPLDTAAPPEEDPTLCDGCGTLTHQGVALGEVCLDFSALVAWDGTTGPW